MDNFYKNFWEKSSCQKSGICSANPVLNALEASLLNELRQVSFYIVKLKEFGFENISAMEKAILALTVNLSDMNFDEKEFLNLFYSIKALKDEIKKFYVDKYKDLNTGLEILNSSPKNELEKPSLTEIIKKGEDIIKTLYNNLSDEKIRLINLIILASRTTSLNLCKLSDYNIVNPEYYFEVLRFLSLTNNTGTREEKLQRRIREFSKISYKIQDELNFVYSKNYGKRKSVEVKRNVYPGKSILVNGDDLDELYNLLLKTKDSGINIYTGISLLEAYTYPEFLEFKNLKGHFGVNESDYDFSNFKGPIYVTKSSSQRLDTAFRGKFFSTKIVPYDKAVKISKDNLDKLIEEALNSAGFEEYAEGGKIHIHYDLDQIEQILKEDESAKVLITIGEFDSSDKIYEKFKNHKIINFELPDETEGVHFVLNRMNPSNLSIYFSKCSVNSLGNITSLLDKNLEQIYLSECLSMIINPHITDALKFDFGIEFI